MADTLITAGVEVRNEKARREITDIVSSVQGFTVRNTASREDCDVLVLEPGEDFNKDCQEVCGLLSSGAVKDVFLVSSRVEPDLLLQAMRSGAREFFPLPVNKEDLVNALVRFREKNRSLISEEKKREKGKIISIIGSKGGIGTTTIAVNVAVSLPELLDKRKPVALLDMNRVFGEVPLFLDMEPAFSWGEAAKNISRLDAAYLMSVLSRHSSGVYVLPSPMRLDGLDPVSPGTIEKLLRFMQREFEYIIVDSGHSLDELSLKVLELSDMVLINSILSLPCLINVKRLTETFKRLGYPSDDLVRVIVNRYHKNSVISLKEAEQGIGKRIFWQIPNDFQSTVSAINKGQTLAAVARRAEITQNIRELALRFTRKTEKEKGGKSVLGWQFMEAKG